ncbi:MAG: hypothetical protein VCA74_04730 [Deltaproteobacteria bacterium]
MLEGKDARSEQAGTCTPARAGEGVDEEVLAGLSHDLANCLHTLRFCADSLAASNGGGAKEAELARMLGEALDRAEGLLRQTFRYVCPLSPKPISLPLADLVAWFESAECTAEVEVAVDEGLGSARVAVDPGLLSEALRAVARSVWGLGEGEVKAVVKVVRRGKVEVSIELLPRQGDGEVHDAAEMAMAARIIEAHGGGLSGPPDRAGVMINLPLEVSGTDGGQTGVMGENGE